MGTKEEVTVRIALCGAVLLPFMKAPDAEFARDCGVLSEAFAGAAPQIQHPLAAMSAEEESLAGGSLELAKERTRLYRALDPSGPKAPYEAEWAGGPVQDMLSLVGGVFRKAGMEPPKDERCDYLGVELAFYQQLLVRELEALDAQDLEAASAFREQRRQFLAEHLGWFSTRYARYAAEQTDSGYFKAHLALLEAFIGGEEAEF